MTTFLTKAQRSLLTDWFIEQLIETGSEFCEGGEVAERAALASLKNPDFYSLVIEQMPSCMSDLDEVF